MLIKLDDSVSKGNWYRANGARRLIIHCPRCGALFINEHAPKRINEDGLVQHVMVCPSEDCSFEDTEMVLEHWTDLRQRKRDV